MRAKVRFSELVTYEVEFDVTPEEALALRVAQATGADEDADDGWFTLMDARVDHWITQNSVSVEDRELEWLTLDGEVI